MVRWLVSCATEIGKSLEGGWGRQTGSRNPALPGVLCSPAAQPQEVEAGEPVG